MSKKKKIRADFRKNRSDRARRTNWTRQFGCDELSAENTLHVRAHQRQRRSLSAAHHFKRRHAVGRRKPRRHAIGRRRKPVPPGPRAKRARALQRSPGRRWIDISLRNAANPENSCHRPAARGYRRRSGPVSAWPKIPAQKKDSSSASSLARECSAAKFAGDSRFWSPISIWWPSFPARPSPG